MTENEKSRAKFYFGKQKEWNITWVLKETVHSYLLTFSMIYKQPKIWKGAGGRLLKGEK